VTTSDLVPHDILVESRFYQEWAEPQHLIDYMGAAIDRSATTATIFNVMRRRGDGMFNEDARQRMRMVAKHVKRAVLIGRVIDKAAARASAFAETMDGISAGMFLVDAAGSIVHANTAGERLLADGTVVRASGLRLLATDAKADRAFNEAVGSAENGDAAIGDRGIALPLAGRDGDYHVAHVLPLSGGERRLTGADYNATAAIFVRKAEMEKANAPEAIVKAYRLTPTELRVLLAIVEVGGVPEVADSLGVAEATVKTHLGHLYAKTGTGRQADLVKLVAGFSSPLLN
jgi:DNA-binding CsgD family transcriptional regulator